jgi:hypothetical protein
MPPVGMQARVGSMIHQRTESYGSKNHDQNDSHEGESPPPPHPRRCDMRCLLTHSIIIEHPTPALLESMESVTWAYVQTICSPTDAICAHGEREPAATLTTRS